MGRRRKTVEKFTKPHLPHKFLCPNCGKNTIIVALHSKENRARIICSNCTLKDEISVRPEVEPIDAYCSFVDHFYEAKEATPDP